jgi:hypothetical protein
VSVVKHFETIAVFQNGGSGSSGLEFKLLSAGAASDGLQWLCV